MKAWLKFYECLAQFDVVGELPQRSSIFQSVHICEAPGAFVAALNHFLQLCHPSLEVVNRITISKPRELTFIQIVTIMFVF